MLVKLLFQNPIVFILLSISLIISISIHEFAHAFIASKLGDPTAKLLGRVTLNPLAHLDPLGTFLLLFAGFGWGKPVPFNPIYLKNPKRDVAIISFAGPASNFLLAILVSIVIHLTPQTDLGLFTLIHYLLYMIAFYNLVLGFFNLIPIHPLDGFKVVNGFLPHELSIQWMQMAPYGIWILLVLIMTDTTSKIVTPLITLTMGVLGLKAF